MLAYSMRILWINVCLLGLEGDSDVPPLSRELKIERVRVIRRAFKGKNSEKLQQHAGKGKRRKTIATRGCKKYQRDVTLNQARRGASMAPCGAVLEGRRESPGTSNGSEKERRVGEK